MCFKSPFRLIMKSGFLGWIMLFGIIANLSPLQPHLIGLANDREGSCPLGFSLDGPLRVDRDTL